MKTRIDETRNMLNIIRHLNEEAGEMEQPQENDNKGAIAITDDPKFGQSVLTSQKDEFKASVDGGAEFSVGDENNPENSPLIYFPDNGNLTFSGRIRNIKWQFVLKDESGEGCYVWCDKLQLTKANMAILNKLQGFYENWRDNWNQEGASLQKLKQS